MLNCDCESLSQKSNRYNEQYLFTILYEIGFYNRWLTMPFALQVYFLFNFQKHICMYFF